MEFVCVCGFGVCREQRGGFGMQNMQLSNSTNVVVKNPQTLLCICNQLLWRIKFVYIRSLGLRYLDYV